MPVRSKATTLVAVRVRLASIVTLASGQPLPARVGDWLITSGPSILAVVPQAHLDEQYEVLQEGGLRLLPAACRALDDRLGPGTTQSADALLRAVTRLASIKVGEVEVRFTPGQLEELAFRATKRGRTLQQEIAQVVTRLESELFHGTIAGQAVGG